MPKPPVDSPTLPEPGSEPTPPSGSLAPAAVTPASDLEGRILGVGEALGEHLGRLFESVPQAAAGPQRLAEALGVDKVFTSRLLKALRSAGDPFALLHHLPGPAPLLRAIGAAAALGPPPEHVAAARSAAEAFDRLIREDLGDRGYLDGILAGYLPAARRELELRSKQAAWRAMAQLLGVSADLNLSAVLLHPSDDGLHVDIVWVFGLLGLRRLRPGAPVQFATRRFSDAPGARNPATLEGRPVRDLEGLRLDRFCSARPAPLEVVQAGDVVHYRLGGNEFGPRSAVDLILAESNRREMQRYVPAESGRKGYVFSEVSTPARALHFDVLVHEEVYPGAKPALHLYDTALDGVADVNDPTRDCDRLDLAEGVEDLDLAPARLGAPGAPRYRGLLAHVFERTGWDARRFRGHRVRIDYPLYGLQVALAFDPPAPPQ